MKNYLQLFGSYVGIALAAVLLYAPWFAGLSPADPSILRAGLSIIAGIVLAGAFVGSTLRTVNALSAPEYRLLDAQTITDVEDVRPVLAGLAKLSYVGQYAEDAMAQVSSVYRKHDRLDKAISAKFEIGSLSWEKFMQVVESATETVVKNAASIANKLQTFDVTGYEEARGQRHSHAYAAKEIAAEHLRLYDETIDEVREILTANERLLLDLARLEDELSDLEDDATRETNNRMVEELQGLVDQTKLYQ